jgi:hypothetical protein
MFDSIIYRLLDKIVTTCERLKKFIQDRSLPNPCRTAKEWRKDYDKWKKNSYK